MAFVLVDRPQYQQVPIRSVVINNDPGTSDDLDVVGIDPNESVMFTVCGFGGNCVLAGDLTAERLALLHREAAEIALFTFKYTDSDTVLATMPPIPGASTTDAPTKTALFFRRKDFKKELGRPIARTLIMSDVPTPQLVAIESPTIERLTRPNLYEVDFSFAQEGSAFVLLTPLL
jgi:hypothetical protein